MENLQISGIKRIRIDNDDERVIKFDPTDILFIERVYKVYSEFQQKQKEYNQHVAGLKKLKKERDKETKRAEEAGEPKKELSEAEMMQEVNEGIAFFKEVCVFTRGRIDYLLGEGSSQTIFGDALSMDAIGLFFEGFMPHVWESRKEELDKYTKKPGGVMP